MTWSLWCILIAGLLPYVATGIAKSGFHAYDNHNPRAWLAKQTGFRARANAAQSNCFESFPFFATAVLVATMQNASPLYMTIFSSLYILARVAYIVAYAADWPNLRSLCWLLGIISIIVLFTIAAH